MLINSCVIQLFKFNTIGNSMKKTIFILSAVTLLITGAFAVNLLSKKTAQDIIV